MKPATLVFMLVAACGGSPGKIVGAASDVSFVAADDALIVYAGGRLARIRINGRGYAHLFARGYSLQDMADDGSVFLLGDKDTNLFIGDPRTGAVRRVAVLNKRAGRTVLSPDKTTIAATRHADFDRPQGLQVDSDAIYLIDVRTLHHRVIARHTRHIVTSLHWSKDGKTLWLSGHKNKQRIDVASGRREVVNQIPYASLHARGGLDRPQRCPRPRMRLIPIGFKGDKGLAIDTPAGRRVLVRVSGRKRGFHDYQATLADAFFNRDCRYVIFQFHGRLWVVDVASARVGPLLEGYGAFLAPPARR